jgi:hypothetical protein
VRWKAVMGGVRHWPYSTERAMAPHVLSLIVRKDMTNQPSRYVIPANPGKTGQNSPNACLFPVLVAKMGSCRSFHPVRPTFATTVPGLAARSTPSGGAPALAMRDASGAPASAATGVPGRRGRDEPSVRPRLGADARVESCNSRFPRHRRGRQSRRRVVAGPA